jgi:hypothetical protein
VKLTFEPAAGGTFSNFLGYFENKIRMPRYPTYPTLYDRCNTLSVTSLKHWGYIEPNLWKRGTVTWRTGDTVTSSISICVAMHPESPYLELSYLCDGQSIRYRVPLVAVPSNLGRGDVWYFLCPFTDKRCRTLYLGDTYFTHRTAFRGMYQQQTRSRKSREFDREIATIYEAAEIYDEAQKPHIKETYRGKPTKRLLRLQKRVEALRRKRSFSQW